MNFYISKLHKISETLIKSRDLTETEQVVQDIFMKYFQPLLKGWDEKPASASPVDHQFKIDTDEEIKTEFSYTCHALPTNSPKDYTMVLFLGVSPDMVEKAGIDMKESDWSLGGFVKDFTYLNFNPNNEEFLKSVSRMVELLKKIEPVVKSQNH